MSIIISSTAQAQSSNVELPTNAYLSAQHGGSGAPTNAYLEAQDMRLSAPVSDYLEPQVVIANPGTPTTARDPNNVTGVGQMIVDTQDGYIGLCTGTLINPRTVIFAAHCVNEEAATAYGQNSGGRPIGFGFGSNNNAAGASAFGGWLGNYATNTARYMYDVNQVRYNPLSTEPGNGFRYADVAIASLDTPAEDIPTWALLFSALPATTITSAGTGYHVVIDGYGNNGTGTTGSTGGIDYRRRIAENTLGALASLDTFESFLFGEPNGLHQNLYWIDFDDPRRGTPGASPYDFNAWRDNAVPNEGITASGDSGGPLILDKTFAQKVVIGVLSGGYSRFYAGQPDNSYGTPSFYQPLYLYWDWIAANNPYHYVSAKAGDGKWSDATHWVTNLDPNYQIIGPNGQLVNGVPGTPGAGTAAQPGFGQACFESGGISDCLDVATGTEKVVVRPIGQDAAGATSNDRGTASVAGLTGSATNQAGGGSQQSFDLAAATLPAATLTNGLPGASNFVPNNSDGDRLNNVMSRYFDVTLSAAGTTTLDTAVTVDRFTIRGNAALDITSTGSLTSLMDINQFSGMINVNGLLRTPGDFFMMTGGLSGSGTIRTPFFTNVAGTISPGTATTTGTLTFEGNVILSSGSLLAINLGANGVSDKIAVKATTFNGTVPTNGTASLGGFVTFAPAAGYTIRAGDSYTFLTTDRPIEANTKFATPAPLSAILTPRLTYQAQSVSVTIDAGLYANVVGNTPVQQAYARLLDQDRIVYDRLRDLYGILDMQNAGTIRSTLEGLAPRAETSRRALGTAAVDNTGRFYRDRLASLEPGNLGGSIAMIGKPFQIAALASSGLPNAQDVRTDAGGGMVTQEGRLPETMSAFVAGGYIDGSSETMPTAIPATARDQFNGFFVAAGIEAEVGSRGLLGFSLAYTDLDGAPSFAGQEAKSKLYQGTLYGKVKTQGGMFIDATFSAGAFESNTVRNVSLAGTSYRLVGKDRSLLISGEIGAGGTVPVSSVIALDPRVSIRGTRIMFDTIDETGGGPALTYKPGSLDSVQTRAGLNAHGNSTTVKPYLSGYWVHDFGRQPGFIGANFVGGVGPNALFAVAGTDRDWAEISGGIAFAAGKNVELSVGANTTLSRSDVSNQSYHGTIKISF